MISSSNTDKSTDYLSLVREEFTKRIGEKGMSVSFCKVKKPITKENFVQDFIPNLIQDADLPSSTAGVYWLPICEEKYPGICRSMTANQAGYYAIRKCKKEEWDFIEDWECVLTNLEMDL